MDLENYEVAQVAQGDAQSVIQMDAIEKANVDVQVATAKQFPRNITRAMQNSIVMATIDPKRRRLCVMRCRGEENQSRAHQYTSPS